MIEIKNISKSFNGKNVLDDVSFVVEEGKIVGLFGQSGIGKSTIAKILCGVIPFEKGEVLIDGNLLVSSSKKYDRPMGKQIQMVYQQPYASLDPIQKIGKGFEELIKYNKLAKSKDEIKTMINKSLMEVGLDESVLSHLPYQISGGEAQRIAIAKSLLFNPKCLILDEATSMLDVATQAMIINLIKQIVDERKISILFISHELELIDYLCDYTYQIKEGKIKRYEK